ncbi:MAG: decaprenylphospho-beta-D-erythro-pentofuranosid-2-ulose 2-reductase [Dehalococcoidia bacterium]|nr:decaprenylphospho-beta-D-erythro-pentofuranosid-2-ulose 2-reductase [Dehalococcoidia bacterium]
MTDALGRARSVLVLGGGSDIGLAIAGRLVARGTRRVVLAGRHPQAMAERARDLQVAGADVATIPFDAADIGAHEKTIAAAFADFGDFDVVVLAFGVLGDQSAFEQEPAAAGLAVVVNYAGAVSAGLAVAKQLRAQGRGRLVVLSSVAGQRARRDNFVYGSSKAGLDAFALGLSEALRGSGAGVLIVRPGFVRTKMTAGRPPAPFTSSSEDVAAAVEDALDREATAVWVPAKLRWVFLVLRLLPQPLFRRVAARSARGEHQ